MATPTDTNRELLTVIARMHAKEGKEQDSGWFFFYENWDSASDLDNHLAAPHLVEFAGRLDDLLDERGLVIERVRRIA